MKVLLSSAHLLWTFSVCPPFSLNCHIYPDQHLVQNRHTFIYCFLISPVILLKMGVENHGIGFIPRGSLVGTVRPSRDATIAQCGEALVIPATSGGDIGGDVGGRPRVV